MGMMKQVYEHYEEIHEALNDIVKRISATMVLNGDSRDQEVVEEDVRDVIRTVVDYDPAFNEVHNRRQIERSQYVADRDAANRSGSWGNHYTWVSNTTDSTPPTSKGLTAKQMELAALANALAFSTRVS